jgi:glucose 1-dehydrogenase
LFQQDHSERSDNLKNPKLNKTPKVVMPTCKVPLILKGRKALVTGANSGIGKAIAIALGEAGADVLVNYHSNEAAAREVVNTIAGYGVKALAYQAGVSDEQQVQAMFREAINHFGTVDILINNAGIQQDAPFDEMTLEQWNWVLSVNLTGQFLCAREAVREFKRRGVVPEVSRSAGKVICISLVHEVIPWAGHVNFAASVSTTYFPFYFRKGNFVAGALSYQTGSDSGRGDWL